MAVEDKIDEERIFMRGEGWQNNIVPHVIAYCWAMPHVTGKRVVDLCSGTGYGTKLLAETAESVIGLDYSKTAVEYARKGGGPKNCKFKVQDLDRITALPDCDVITCMQGLEHLDDPTKIISRYPDKTWIVALPNEPQKPEPISHHHHKVTADTIYEWFGDQVNIAFFNDQGERWTDITNDRHHTNYWAIYES